MAKAFTIPITALLLTSLLLSGCGNHQAEPHPQQPDYTQQYTQGPGQVDSYREPDIRNQGAPDLAIAAPSPTANSSPSPTPNPTVTPDPQAKASDIIVKGIYVNPVNMKGPGFNRMLRLVQTTDLNAMVIDIKNESGYVTYDSAIPQVKEIGSSKPDLIPDLKGKLKQLKDNKIYTIGRIVAFKDPYLAGAMSEYAMQRKTGGVWRDQNGVAWVDPYKKQVWDYNIKLAKEAAQLGFDEIQFDYVRFPDNGRRVDQQVQFQNPAGLSKAQAIQGFLKQAKEELGPQVPLSADVFGLTTSSQDDMGIGQKWEEIAPTVDIISPMIYPSHYSKGMYKVANPDLEPASIINAALRDAKYKNSQLTKKSAEIKTAKVRPWYQDFTAKWVHPHQRYGNAEVREQIKAGQQQGIEEFLLWNPSGRYSYR